MTGRALSKSPAPPARRSSRQSTPTRVTSPGPTTRSTRSSGIGLVDATAGAASLAPPVPTANVAGSASSALGVPRSASKRALSPRASMIRSQRPALPLKHINRLMNPVGGSDAAQKERKTYRVKTQILDLGDDNGHIGIARVKVPVPKGVPGHIIKRFDTDAVSASSMFRAAFPTASEQDEAIELRWITSGSRGKYGDTVKAGNELNESKKLSGTWIPAENALELAEEYSIQRFTVELINYVPSAEENPEPADAPTKDVVPEAQSAREASPVQEAPVVRSPRSTKRARVTASEANEPQILSGASAEGVSILQTLSTAPDTGVVTETTEVKLDVPLDSALDTTNGLVASDEQIEAQLNAAKELVQSLKDAKALSELASESHIPSAPASAQKKRAVDDAELDDRDEESVPTSGTLADLVAEDNDDKIVDNRSFFGKLFRKKQRRVPVQAARETRALPSREVVVALPVEEQQVAEGRRWVAGFGLAVAVGATAAAPYLFG
ncbi:uncharacterized protein JCM15063_002771 [Sporobolomyces koalae]|uniref:uncharacterized protein n=1 Tax=Sporobolomyces koalae TaxID=500713 RepID=UPI0031746EB4